MFELPDVYTKYLEYLPIFSLSVLAAFFLTPIAGWIARKFNVIANPPSMRLGLKSSDVRHLEKQPTPLLGGIAIIIPLIVLSFVTTNPTPEITALFIAISILFLMGIIDDIHELSGRTQLVVQVLAALFLSFSVIDLTHIGNPFGGIIPLDQLVYIHNIGSFLISIVLPGDLLLLAWILVCTIAVKFSGGTDGLMEGNSLIAGLIFFLLSVRFIFPVIATVSIIFSGLMLGLLFYNFYPAKIRSGSSGKSTYGFILAVLSMLSGAKFATAIVILLLPLTDFFVVLIRRYLKHRPKNPFELLNISDKTHLHHQLLELGMSEKTIAFTEYAVTGVLGLFALAISGTYKAFLILAAILIVFTFITFLSGRAERKRISAPPQDGSPESKYSY